MPVRQNAIAAQRRGRRFEGTTRPATTTGCEGCVHRGAAKQLAAVADFSGDAIILTTAEGAIREWSKGARRMYGYTAREVLRRPVSVLAQPGRMDEIRDVLERSGQSRGVISQESVHLGKDGRPIDVALAVWGIHDRTGRAAAFSIVARDISSMKRDARLRSQEGDRLRAAAERLKSAQRQLRDSHQDLAAARESASSLNRYRDLFECAPQSYLVTDPEGVIREANAAAGRLLGVEPARLAGLPLASFLGEDERRALRDRLAELRRLRGVQQWECRFRPHTRPPFEAAVSAVFARDPAGAASSVRWCLCDITALCGERSELLQENRRLAGELSCAKVDLAGARQEMRRIKTDYAQCISALCHDLRSPLMSIEVSARLLVEESGDECEGRLCEAAGMVQKGVERLSTIIQGLSEDPRFCAAELNIADCDPD